jgi:hypothetical protein
MKLYLQKNYNGTFAIAMENPSKNEIFPCDYIVLMDEIRGTMPYKTLVDLVVEKFGCKKLVLDF